MKHIFLVFFSFLLLTQCTFYSEHADSEKITSINIIDHHGTSETINSKERLDAFENTDFLSPQPYQKVLRIYGREKNGNVRSCITSYHPNGQIKQYLEAVNDRALGVYREWHPNGVQKVEAHIVGGVADINTQAEQSWLFDGLSRAWDTEGHVAAEIRYLKGELQGEATYYHSNSRIWKICPYEQGGMHGTMKIFLDDGSLFQTTEYKEGRRDGPSLRYWLSSSIACQETYQKEMLKEGRYFDIEGNLVSSIKEGTGDRALFGKRELLELQHYKNGVQEGVVKVFDSKGNLTSLYAVKNGERHGEAIDYFPLSQQPKLLVTWNKGLLQGPMKTWYENGQLECQREMCGNQKHGLLTSWYDNGALMLVEEYDCDKLLKGEYYKTGEKVPISQIERGKGIATLFNSEGNFSKKVYYQDGKPQP